MPNGRKEAALERLRARSQGQDEESRRRKGAALERLRRRNEERERGRKRGEERKAAALARLRERYGPKPPSREEVTAGLVALEAAVPGAPAAPSDQPMLSASERSALDFSEDLKRQWAELRRFEGREKAKKVASDVAAFGRDLAVELGKDLMAHAKFTAREMSDLMGLDVAAGKSAPAPFGITEEELARRETPEAEEELERAARSSALLTSAVLGGGAAGATMRAGAPKIAARLAGEATAGALYGGTRPLEEGEDRARAIARDVVLFPAVGLAGEAAVAGMRGAARGVRGAARGVRGAARAVREARQAGREAGFSIASEPTEVERRLADIRARLRQSVEADLERHAPAKPPPAVVESKAGKTVEIEEPLTVEGQPTSKLSEAGHFDFEVPQKGIRGLWQRYFTSAGDLPKDVFQSKISRDASVSSQMSAIAFTLSDFRRAARRVYGGLPGAVRVPAEQLKLLDQALKGQVPLDAVPRLMRPSVKRMREEIDALSRRLISSGAVEGELVGKVTDNLGVYATRSYRVFDDPKWAQKVPEEVRNKAKALLRSEHPGWSEAQLEGRINELLMGKDSPIEILARSKTLGSKDLSILQKRKEVPPEIRALWGEYEDPMVNYARSVTKMANLIANHEMLSDIRRAGMGRFFFQQPEGEFSHRIAAEGSKVLAPLNGLYTNEAIANAFRESFEPIAAGSVLRGYMKVVGFTKYAKTVGSVMTHIRNTVGNIGFAVANGHWRGVHAAKAFKATATRLFSMGNEQWRAYYRKLQELGVVAESARAEELRAVIRDASKSPETEILDAPVKRSLKWLQEGITNFYRAEDDLWKIYAWENEVARYSRALPNLPREQIERRAAEIVRNTYPTYSMVPQAVQKWGRRQPILGNFVSFPSEVVRTTYHLIGLIRDELADPRLRSIGIERLAGASAAAAIPSALAIASRQWSGTTREDDADLRRFLPPWSKNSELLMMGRDDEDRPRFVDFSYTDPHSFLRKPVVTALRGGDWSEVVKDIGLELSEPYFSEGLLTGTLFDIARNRTKSGRRVYNPEAPFMDRWQDIVGHVWNPLEPGTVSSMKRIWKGVKGEGRLYGRAYDPRLEAIAVVTGQRLQTLDVRQALSYRAAERVRAFRDASQQLTDVVGRRGTVTDAEIRKAYLGAERTRRRHFEEAHEDVQAAIRLGVTQEEVVEILRSRGVSEEQAIRIVRGQYRPYTPGDQFLASLEKQALSITDDPEQQLEIVRDVRRRRELIEDLALEQIRKREADDRSDR